MEKFKYKVASAFVIVVLLALSTLVYTNYAKFIAMFAVFFFALQVLIAFVDLQIEGKRARQKEE